VTEASFTLGARFDNNSRFGKTFNPRIGIVYKPFARTTVKALYNSAFLAPSPLIAFQHYGTFYTEDEGQTYKSFFWHLPNPGLKPIRSKNLEFSLSQFVTSDFSVTATAYVTMLKDLIRNDADAANGNIYNGRFMGWEVNYIETSVNQGKQLNYGGTLQLNHSVSLGMAKFKSYASFSYVDGEAEYITDQAAVAGNARKVEIDFIAPVHVRLGSDITINKFSISPRLIMVGKQRISGFVGEDYASARQTIQGYTLLNAAVRYRLGKSFAVFCNVENALNQRYRNVGEFMDLKTENTPYFDGKPQNPLRVMGGISFTL
jgi:outer membrane receptor protein involved in Fe transport